MFTPSGQLLVADDGSAGTSAVSPYRIAPDGTMQATQAAVPDGQTAACWISRAWNGDVFADNAGSGTIGSYQLSPAGQLTFLQNTSAGTGAVPLDNAVSSDGRALYVLLNRSADELAEFSVGPDAQLTPVGTQALPTGFSRRRRELTLRAASRAGGFARTRTKPPAPGLPLTQMTVSDQMCTDLPSRIEHRLVNRVAGRTKLGGQRVEGNPVDGDRHEHAALPLA